MRADSYLAQHGYAPSRQRAQLFIEAGCVTVDGHLIKKAAEDIDDGEHTVCVRDPFRYVGRGGEKLEGALLSFSLDVTGLRALDIGASTGGFTDCLLQHGAREVWAVDAGEGQLAKKLCDDPRVHSREHLNARYLTLDDIGGAPVDIIVMDVSFISATYILPRFTDVLCESGIAICLIKPQFELDRTHLGKGGVVKDPSAHRMAVERVANAATEAGLSACDLIRSPIKGGDGNREFLILLKKQQGGEVTALPLHLIRRVTGG